MADAGKCARCALVAMAEKLVAQHLSAYYGQTRAVHNVNAATQRNSIRPPLRSHVS